MNEEVKWDLFYTYYVPGALYNFLVNPLKNPVKKILLSLVLQIRNLRFRVAIYLPYITA